jgi:hypothetical protein
MLDLVQRRSLRDSMAEEIPRSMENLQADGGRTKGQAVGRWIDPTPLTNANFEQLLVSESPHFKASLLAQMVQRWSFRGPNSHKALATPGGASIKRVDRFAGNTDCPGNTLGLLRVPGPTGTVEMT